MFIYVFKCVGNIHTHVHIHKWMNKFYKWYNKLIVIQIIVLPLNQSLFKFGLKISKNSKLENKKV